MQGRYAGRICVAAMHGQYALMAAGVALAPRLAAATGAWHTSPIVGAFPACPGVDGELHVC